MSDLAPIVIEAIHHYAPATGHAIEQTGINVFTHAVNRISDRVLGRLFGSDENLDAPALRKSIERIEATVARAVERIDSLEAGGIDFELLDDPQVLDFIFECLASATQTPNSGKHVLLGDFIADRMQYAIESLDELTLRQATRIVTECNSEQLTALVRVMLVSSPPLSFERPLASSEVLRLVQDLDEASVGASTNWQDMRYLVSVNAITERDIPDAASPWTNFIEAWRLTFKPYVDADDIMKIEHRIYEVARNKTRLGSERATGVAFGQFILTPAGYRIAVDLAAHLTRHAFPL